MNYIRCLYEERTFWAEEKGGKAVVLTAAPYRGGIPAGEEIPLEDVKLIAPFDGTKIVAIGKNYADHIKEMQADFGDAAPEKPILFFKPTTSVNDPDGKVVYPAFSHRVDFEGELAAVIGKKASRVKAENALEYVFGYTICNDITARDIQKSEGQWTRGKAVDGFAPVGPRIVTSLDPAAQTVITRLNGEEKQHGTTDCFITPLPELIAFITESMTLLPGDLVITGTPAGVGPMQAGDAVEVEIPSIGILRNTIVSPESER